MSEESKKPQETKDLKASETKKAIEPSAVDKEAKSNTTLQPQDSTAIAAKAKGEIVKLERVIADLKETYSGKPGYNPFIYIKDVINPTITKLKNVVAGKIGADVAEEVFDAARGILASDKSEVCKVEVSEDLGIFAKTSKQS